MSCRPLKILQASRSSEPERLNVYDVLRVHTIVIPERELERVKEVWS